MTINAMTAEVDIKLLKPHADNVNQGDVGAIVESIQRNGFYGRIVVNKRNNHILAGNHRYLAAMNLGFETIPVEYVDIDERDEVRLLLVDNRTTRLGVDDESGLAELLSTLIATEQGLAGTGFDNSDLDELIGLLAKSATDASESLSEDNQPEQEFPEERCAVGQVWQLDDSELTVGEDVETCDALLSFWEKITRRKARLVE